MERFVIIPQNILALTVAAFDNPAYALSAAVILMEEEVEVQASFGVYPADLNAAQVRQFFGVVVQ